MKKLISLLVAIAMVMGLATVAFAAAPVGAGDHSINAAADIPTSVTLAAGETATYTLVGGPNGDPAAEAAWAVFGKELKVTSDKPGKLWIVPGWYGIDLENGSAKGTPDGHPMWGSLTFAIENTGTETATYGLEWLGLPGTIGNPDPLDVEWTNMPYMQEDHAGDFYYTYTAGDTAEVLTISDVVLTYNAMNMKNVTFNIMMTRDDNKEVSMWSEGDEYADEIYMPLAAGQSVSVMVRAKETDATYMPPSVEFKASVAPVTEISMAGDYQVEAEEAWYAVNSMLAGYTIVINGDDAYMIVDGVRIDTVDGVATAILNGEGAVISVGVFGAEDMIILPTPVEINAAGDYTADVAAGAVVEYAINSKLAGAVLTVKGEGAYIMVGTTKIEAVDGVASYVLDGEGAVFAIKIGNESEAAAQYELNIAYPPVVITATGDYTANIGAGAEVEYAINSKLAGAILTVKGEKAYIVMGDTTVKAVDGVASIVLDGEGATIAVKIGNEGTASAEIALNIDYAPEAINATGDYTANVPAKGEVEFVVNSKLDGAVVTVKGEGAYLIVNGKKIEGKDGVVTATLKAEAATISLIVGNAGDEAAQYTVNVDLPAGNPATGDMGIIAAAVTMAVSAIGGVAVVAKKKEF